MPEMTEKAPLKKQHRKKNRETHNAVERHRKKKINAGINRIGELIPCSPALKQSKNMILDQAYKYITEMKRQNDEFLLNGGNSEQAEEIKKLRRQLDEIQKENGRYIALLKANDICLYDDPTIHWKGNLKNTKVSVVIPNNPVQKKKDLKNANVSVVIPSDQGQKNIIVYSNGSPLGASNQGAPVQGITFNISPNLQKQTANVVPVQRTCNLVTPVTISGIYSSEDKSGAQTAISPVASTLPNPAKKTLEPPTSENKQAVLTSTSAASSQSALQSAEIAPEIQSPLQTENDTSISKNRLESSHLPEKAGVSSSSLASNVGVGTSHATLADTPSKEDSRTRPQECPVVSAADTSCSPSVRLSLVDSVPSGSVFKSTDATSGSGAVAAPPVEILKTVTETNLLPTTTLDKWPFSSSSGIGTPGSKNMGSLTRMASAGNTQTTWTTLQLAGNTVQPLNHTPPSIMTALLNESATDSSTITSIPNKCLATLATLNNPLPTEERTPEQHPVSLPSCQSLPMQPLVTKTQVIAQPPGSLLPLNPTMQVIRMSHPVGPAVAASPANQNVIILQSPNTHQCPPVLRAEVPNQTVSQQIVIIQTANQNPFPLFSAPPPSVRMPVNGAASAASTSSSTQNTSVPQMFGGKHLVHILPRPSSSSQSSNSTQSLPTAMSNQQLPQTISLNGQLFALKPVKSCSGASDQAPMQIIQPTTSEDPNTNVALNTFGALANLNQSISQMAGQSCLPLSISQTPSQTTASNLTTKTNSVLLTPASTPSSAAECSVLTSALHPADTPSSKASVSVSLGLGSKRSNKKPSTKKCLVGSSTLACQTNPCKDSKKLDSGNTETAPEHPGGDVLLENISVNVVLQNLAMSQTNNGVAPEDENASDSHPKETLRTEQDVESTSAPDLNVIAVTRSSPLESTVSGPFEVVASISKDCASPLLQTCRSEPELATTSQLPESKCIPTISLTSPTDTQVTISWVSGTPVTNSGTTAESIPRTEVSGICRVEQNCSIIMQATDLLEGQGLTKMLSDLDKESEVVQKHFSVQVEHPGFRTQSTKPVMDANDLAGKQEGLLLMNTEGENLAQSHTCGSEQEPANNSLTASRQSDSPMSTSSGSSCGFSVASMLPDSCRENVPNSSSVNTCSSCTFSEQTDIVALAARAIFDQETLTKNPATVPVSSTSKADDVATLGRDQPFKTRPVKDTDQIEMATSNFGPQNTIQINIDRSTEKPSCSVGIEMPNTPLQIPNSQSSNTSSLSVNNLIHQSCVIHPPVSCSGLSSPSAQATVPAAVTPSIPANSYMNRSPGQSPVLMTDYAPQQLSALRTSNMQAPQMCEPHLKQESRKESVKRSVQDDHLVSASKRQKHCQAAPLQLEGIALLNQTASDISDQTQILVTQVPPNSSNPAVSVSSQGHSDGHSRLFPTSNFVPPSLRQVEVQCNSQPSILDQSSQSGQHLQPIQHAPAQGMVHLHNNHPYIKQQQQQQQQAGQLRDRHHLYQLQHHISYAESPLHSQAHSVHPQQRVMHQEAQMQKKRTLIQNSQSFPAENQLTLQQKHHGGDQTRQKSNQPHPHHPQMQQMQQHFASSQPEKSCENPAANRAHHGRPQSHLSQDVLHQQPPDVGNRQPGSGVSSEHVTGHSQMQRLMTSRALEQQMVSQASIVTRPSEMTSHRQERNRVSSYSAEALIGKSPSNSEQRHGGISIQSSRISDQEMRNYLDVSRNKGLVIHNMQGRMSVDHSVGSDVQKLVECQTFKTNGANQQPSGNFDVQASRNSEIGNLMPSLRGMQAQTFRIAHHAGPSIDRPKRMPYQPVQGISTNPLPPPRDNENACHQGFMQSLLAPHLGDQASGSQRSISEHQRNPQCGPSSIVEYNCSPARESIHIRRDGDGQNRESCDMSLGALNNRNNSLNIPFSSSSSGDIQCRNTSPNISIQKSNSMRMTESHGTKSHMNTPVSSNVHGIVRPALPHPPVSRGNADQVPPSVRQPNSSVTQRTRHHLQDNGGSKIRQPERSRSGNQRHGNAFDPSLPHLPLPSSGSMILGRQQPTLEKRSSIMRFMPDGPQMANDNAAPDQHSLSQNFGFPFIPEGGMNPPINANASFIPPVTQSSATRTPALIPVDPQNTLPSFYPPYSPAHPTLSNDISIPYFSNQMFPNPSTEKPNGGSLNNRFGSILSPPRPVGFAQPSFPLLTDMPPMHMANSSHLSNFNLTSLFPEIATALPPDGSAISPLLSIGNTSASDSSKQSSNRPAHNISHILGHDCSSAV